MAVNWSILIKNLAIKSSQQALSGHSYIFNDTKEGVLVDKTDLESMLDESGFGALLLKWEDSHWIKAHKYPWHQNLFGHPSKNEFSLLMFSDNSIRSLRSLLFLA